MLWQDIKQIKDNYQDNGLMPPEDGFTVVLVFRSVKKMSCIVVNGLGCFVYSWAFLQDVLYVFPLCSRLFGPSMVLWFQRIPISNHINY